MLDRFMIEVKDLSKYYKVQSHKKCVFEGVNLILEGNKRLGLIGPNGAGKSTFLRVVTGVERPTSGAVIRRCTMSWPVGLSLGFISALTGKENIQLVCRLFDDNVKKMKERVNFVCDFSELSTYFKLPVATYSSGMKARLAFSLSMAFDFDYYVIDEVLSVGDNHFKKKCQDIFSHKTQNSGLIIVSHNMKTIRDFCNEGIYLNNGQFFYSNDINQVIGKYEQRTK